MANRMGKSDILKLYKAILKIHKSKLPAEERQLGDNYVRSEWKLHKSVKPNIADNFLNSWKDYFRVLKSQSNVTGRQLGEEQLNKLGLEQREQLNNLKEEALKAFKKS